MAYISTGKDYDTLISNLRRHRVIRSDRVEEAMRKVDRKFYCPDGPYYDSPQSIGYGVTISAPHMHAHALEKLKDHATEGAKVLDVGCGSGYLTAVLAHMVGDNGCVVGIEHLQELVNLSRRNIERGNPELLRPGSRRVKLVYGDGRLGWSDEAPYDAIHVGAGARDMPEALIEQLKPGGRIICPVGDGGFGQQQLMQIDKAEDGTVHTRELMDVMFVPLCDAQEQWSGARPSYPSAAFVPDEPPMPYVQ